jgi:hypothetical protein
MRIESPQIRNFINGEFVEPIHSPVIPSKVEESLDICGRSLL